ncbi:hypothetical protein ACFL96_01140 [Thermoproteota archaeon]
MPKRKLTPKDKSGIKSLFVCSYRDGLKNSYVQLEDLRTNKVLDTWVLRDSPGIRDFRTFIDPDTLTKKGDSAPRVVGICGDELLVFTIDGHKLSDPVFLDIPGVKGLDVYEPTSQIVISLDNGSIEIGEIIKDHWQARYRFQPDLETEITALDFHTKDLIIFGLANGETMGFQHMKDGWLFYKVYFKHKKAVAAIQACSQQGIIASISENSDYIVFSKPDGTSKAVKMKQRRKKEEKTKILYLEFPKKKNANYVMYVCDNGKVGKIPIPD